MIEKQKKIEYLYYNKSKMSVIVNNRFKRNNGYKRYISLFVGILLTILMICIIVKLYENNAKIYKFDTKNLACKYINKDNLKPFCKPTSNKISKICTIYYKCLKAIDEFYDVYTALYLVYYTIFVYYITFYIYSYMIYGTFYMNKMYKCYIEKSNTPNDIIKKYKSDLGKYFDIIKIDIVLFIILLALSSFNWLDIQLDVILIDGQNINDMINNDRLFRTIITFYPIINSIIYVCIYQFLNVLNK